MSYIVEFRPKNIFKLLFFISFLLAGGVGGTVQATAAEKAPVVQVFECDDLTFTVEIRENEAWLFLPDFSGPLPRVASGSGTRYEANNIVFWSKGEQAMLSYGNLNFEDCYNNPGLAVWEQAKLRGVDFRAVGNEPGWVLEISGGKLSLLHDYGNKNYQFPRSHKVSDRATGSTVYSAEAEGNGIEVTLQPLACQDSMVDASYETTVTIEVDGRSLTGCGKALH